MIIGKLFSPLNYLRIFHIEKLFFDLFLPILFTILFMKINNILPNKIHILGDKGIVSLVNGIVQILAGFYIASLAAISTASLPLLDEEMKGIPPKFLGKKSNQTITRRLFLTHLFGYLAFMSLFVYFLGGLSQIIKPNIEIFLNGTEFKNEIKNILTFMYMFIIFNLIFSTILGLFFMIENNINKKINNK